MRARLIVAVLAIASVSCDVIRETQRSALFQPHRADTHLAQAEQIDGLERWWLEVEGGRVEAWYLPALPARTTPGPAVIVAHGNTETIDDWAARAGPYRAMGLAVLLPEYRGYGRSDGQPSEEAILEDFAHFYDRLVDRPEIDPLRVAMHGYSLGGGVVGVLSDRRRTAALILESTFTNVPDVASRWMAPAASITDRFDTRGVLLRSSTPTLILHGVDDTTIPVRHAVELDRVAWDSRVVLFEADHELPRGETYWRHIRAFLEEADVQTSPASSEAEP